jgi:hypothetical protein
MSNTFFTTSNGINADTAFNNAIKEARENPHFAQGASGTIAEKEEFIVFDGYVSYDPVACKELAEKIINRKNTDLNDGYGPAGCIHVGENEYLFFGTAFSSD